MVAFWSRFWENSVWSSSFISRLFRSEFMAGRAAMECACPYCGQRLMIASQTANRPMRCVSCDGILLVPWQANLDALADVAARQVPPAVTQYGKSVMAQDAERAERSAALLHVTLPTMIGLVVLFVWVASTNLQRQQEPAPVLAQSEEEPAASSEPEPPPELPPDVLPEATRDEAVVTEQDDVAPTPAPIVRPAANDVLETYRPRAADPAPPIAREDEEVALRRATSNAALGYGIHSFWERRYENAIDSFVRAQEDDPTNAAAGYFLALVYARSGQKELAEETLAAAVELEAVHPVANWGRLMERVQGRQRLWLEEARMRANSRLVGVVAPR
jgi:tetratricopeptide (TPR) repeat protein/endogenous inhibitor of DNA gyrase (YacG/DUF329 family)